MIKVGDLAGLSKPLTRLIEVVAKGIGGLSAPYLVRRNADARAYAVKTIAAALDEVADQHGLPAVVKYEAVEVWQRPEDGTLRLDAVGSEARAASRIEYQERKRQANIEAITAGAAEELSGAPDASAELPDEDWISRFFAAAEDVSSEEMRNLWARVLAGEVKSPGSFSLRTIDFMRSVTKRDAELIEKMGRVALRAGSQVCVPIHDKVWLKTERDVRDKDLFDLAELGLMYPGDLAFQLFLDGNTLGTFISGSKILILKRDAPGQPVKLPVWRFTQVGQQLLQLIENVGDEELLHHLGRFYLPHVTNVAVSDILSYNDDGSLTHSTPREVTA